MWNQTFLLILFTISVDCIRVTRPQSRNATTTTTAAPEAPEVKHLIDNLIKQNTLMVFSKTYCPFSKRAKKLLFETHKIRPQHVLELDERDDMKEIQDYLSTLSGVHTVPQVFINGKFVGGATDLEEMDREGKLKRMLRRARLL